MTDEERRKLCTALREWKLCTALREWNPYFGNDTFQKAADEIERLAEELRLAKDTIAQVRARLELRVSELERKAPW